MTVPVCAGYLNFSMRRFMNSSRCGLLSVVPANRAYATQPLGFIAEQLEKRYPEDIDSLLAFNMIAGGKYSKGKAGDYHVFA